MLQPGQTIKMPNDALAEVISVNDSRAHIKLLTKTEKVFSTTFSDQEVRFASSGQCLDISPNSEVEIITGSLEKEFSQ